MADPGTVQSFCDHIGIEPVSAALRAIDRHNTEHVWLVLQDGRRVYYHTEAALLSLDLLPGYVLRAVGVGGIAWEGSDWEWARECPPDPGWKGLDRLRDVILGGRECVRDVGLPKFGLRVECVGDRTLGEFLAEHGVDLPE